MHNIYSKIITQWVALVGCVKAQGVGGGGGGTDVNPYIFLKDHYFCICLRAYYTDHIHTEDSKLPHSKYI